MRRFATAGVLLAVLVAGLLPASAQVRPHVVDPRGDWAAAGQDIVSATFSTISTRTGKRALEIRLELAGPPQPDAGLYWEVGWRTPDCELSYIEYSRSSYGPGLQHAELIRACDGPDGDWENGLPATGRLQGSTIVLTTPLSGRFPLGTVLTKPYAGSWTFVLVAPGVPVYTQTDATAPGRPYRVGSRN